MRRLDLTLPTPEENVALDEALLDFAEDENGGGEYLRIWEATGPMVVLGRSSRISQEVNEPACRSDGVPILRRSSGGAAIVAGEGCLMYALVLSHEARLELKDIGRAHAYVLDRLAGSLRSRLASQADVARAGTSDLIISHAHGQAVRKKFSGNSMRMKRSHLLYHGTLLYDFDLALLEAYLKMPPRQPDYRDRRPHHEFVTNLPISRQSLVDAIDDAWVSESNLLEWPRPLVARLVAERFRCEGWTREFV